MDGVTNNQLERLWRIVGLAITHLEFLKRMDLLATSHLECLWRMDGLASTYLDCDYREWMVTFSRFTITVTKTKADLCLIR